MLLEVNDEVRAGLIRDTSPDDLIQAVGDLDLDDLADILNDLPDDVITEVLRAMDRQDRDRLAQVMSYPEDSAGGLMNPDVVTVRPDVSLDVVLRYVATQAMTCQRSSTSYLSLTGRGNTWVNSSSQLY